MNLSDCSLVCHPIKEYQDENSNQYLQHNEGQYKLVINLPWQIQGLRQAHI